MVQLLLIVLFAFVDSKKPVPDFVYLSAPYTPFKNGDPNYALNLSAVAPLALQQKEFGVNVAWIGGGMGQFTTMTVSERNSLTEAWALSPGRDDLYLIAHVGSNILSEAKAMAKFAYEQGVDAIASVPPFYSRCSSTNFDCIFNWFNEIMSEAPGLDFWYYHIPGSTGYNINIPNFITASLYTSPGLKSLTGIKYVSDMGWDWFNSCNNYSNPYDTTKQKIYMAWAPEPKMQSFANCMGRGAILAEDFYANTFICMRDEYQKGNVSDAWNEQIWKHNMDSLFSSLGSGSKRCVYLKYDIDIGPPRPPSSFTADCKAVVEQLDAAGFYDRILTNNGCDMKDNIYINLT